jgi:hypothetical protein
MNGLRGISIPSYDLGFKNVRYGQRSLGDSAKFRDTQIDSLNKCTKVTK